MKITEEENEERRVIILFLWKASGPDLQDATYLSKAGSSSRTDADASGAEGLDLKEQKAVLLWPEESENSRRGGSVHTSEDTISQKRQVFEHSHKGAQAGRLFDLARCWTHREVLI